MEIPSRIETSVLFKQKIPRDLPRSCARRICITMPPPRWGPFGHHVWHHPRGSTWHVERSAALWQRTPMKNSLANVVRIYQNKEIHNHFFYAVTMQWQCNAHHDHGWPQTHDAECCNTFDQSQYLPWINSLKQGPSTNSFGKNNMPSKSISDNGKLHNFIHRNCAGQTGMNSQYSMFFKNRRTYVPFICFSVCGCTTMASQIFVALQQKSWVAKTILDGNITVEKRSEKIKEEKECKKKTKK